MPRGSYGLQRIVNLATALLDGLMSKADKAKLDASTAANNWNTLVQRSADGSIAVGNFAAAGGATVAGSLVANQTVQGNALSAKSALLGGVGGPVGNILGLIPGADSDVTIVFWGTNAANSAVRWYIRQDGYFSGTAANATNAANVAHATSADTATNATNAANLTNAHDRYQLDNLDLAAPVVTVNTINWSKKQVAAGKYMYTAQIAVTLPAFPDALVVNNATTPSSLPLNGYDFFASYCGAQGGQINANFRPFNNGEPNFGAQNQFQVAISTMPQASGPVNLNAKGTTGVVFLMFVER